MIHGDKNSTQTLDSSSYTIELMHGQEPEMDSVENNFTNSEVTHQSVNERTYLPTELTFRQVEKLCGLLASRIELETTGNSETTGWRREDTSTGSTSTGTIYSWIYIRLPSFEQAAAQCFLVSSAKCTPPSS